MATFARAWDLDADGSAVQSPDLLHRESLVAALRAFAISRAILAAVTAMVALVSHASPVAIWGQWDSLWYLGIAAHGYHWILPGHHASLFAGSTLAFFPLLPLLLQLGERIGLDGTLSGVLIANLSFLGALLYIHALIRKKWGTMAAGRGLLLLSLWPTAFFTAAPYTESLFLLAAAGALHHAGKREIARTGVWIAVALITRSTGLIVLVPAIMLLQPRRVVHWLLLIGPGIAVWGGFLLYLAAEHVPLTYLLSAQRAWHRGLTFPWTGFVASIDWLLHNTFLQPQLAVENAGDLLATIGMLWLTALAWRSLSQEVRAYCAGFWLLVLCSPEWLDRYAAPFSSMDRFVLALFPLAGWAATSLPQRRYPSVIGASATIMAVLAAVHLSGSWIG
jgi:hypothetical protein